VILARLDRKAEIGGKQNTAKPGDTS